MADEPASALRALLANTRREAGALGTPQQLAALVARVCRRLLFGQHEVMVALRRCAYQVKAFQFRSGRSAGAEEPENADAQRGGEDYSNVEDA
jgi:hypothetical protein